MIDLTHIERCMHACGILLKTANQHDIVFVELFKAGQDPHNSKALE